MGRRHHLPQRQVLKRALAGSDPPGQLLSTLSGGSMQALLRLIQSISRFSGEATAWLVVPLILATTYDVVARYAFNAPTQWAYEVGYMVMGTHALLGMAYTLREHGHIRIDAFTQRLSQGTKAVVDLVGYLVVLPCLVWVTWSLWDYWRLAYRTGHLSG